MALEMVNIICQNLMLLDRTSIKIQAQTPIIYCNLPHDIELFIVLKLELEGSGCQLATGYSVWTFVFKTIGLNKVRNIVKEARTKVAAEKVALAKQRSRKWRLQSGAWENSAPSKVALVVKWRLQDQSSALLYFSATLYWELIYPQSVVEILNFIQNKARSRKRCALDFLYNLNAIVWVREICARGGGTCKCGSKE